MRLLAEQKTQRLMDITGRDAAQVQDWQQGVSAGYPPSLAWQQG
jgi:hypothetical protein